MFAVLKRDFKSYFNSPIAYVLIGLFMFLSSYFFNSYLSYGVSDITSNVVSDMSFLLLFVIPILTMKSMAEDKKNGTEVLLLTSPARITEIVMGKFLALYCVFLIMTGFTLIFPIILTVFGDPDLALIFSSYLGFVLYGAVFVAVGLFASSLTENQIVAAIIGFVGLFALYTIRYLASYFSGFLYDVFTWLSIADRYNDFMNGIIDISSVIFMISLAAIFIYLTVRVVERKRWSQG
ncbi:MAG: ABC transporter permease subunit [Clostridiaceae bacterium]|nr:ABC transporter permease subunit [Clostridiaceae bacterium]